MLAKDQSLILRYWFALKAPLNAFAAIFEVIKPRKGSENSETVSWKQTYSSNISFSWSDSLAAQFYRLKRSCTHTEPNANKIERVFLNKNTSKWEEGNLEAGSCQEICHAVMYCVK